SLSVRSNQKQDFQSGCKKCLERRKFVIQERGFDSNPSVLILYDDTSGIIIVEQAYCLFHTCFCGELALCMFTIDRSTTN
ncbi:MAG: hypothetical protein ACBR12_26690, partial [Microcoleus sp.]